MDFSQLPYELQFRLLSGLTDREAFFYCRANRRTWEIWLTPVFWEARARRTFGVSLSHAEASSPFEQYQELVRLERDEPSLILILAILDKSLDQIPRYFRKACLLTFENETLRYQPLLSMLLTQLVEEGSKELLTVLLKSMQEQIGTKHSYHLQIIAQGSYDLARKQNRADLEELLDSLLDQPSENPLEQSVL
jgi:hypothetical protein